MARYPTVLPDWQFDNRPVDLVAEGFDAAIGGGFSLAPGLVARELAPAHVVAVASPGYMHGRAWPATPAELATLDGIQMRSMQSGRISSRAFRNRAGETMETALRTRLVLNDPEAICRAALLGLGVGLLILPDVMPHLQSGQLVRLLPDWYQDAGPLSLYFSAQRLLPAKTRVFVDHVVALSRSQGWAERFSAA